MQVSILTHPYGRMQHGNDYGVSAFGVGFQSSPTLTGGCNLGG